MVDLASQYVIVKGPVVEMPLQRRSPQLVFWFALMSTRSACDPANGANPGSEYNGVFTTSAVRQYGPLSKAAAPASNLYMHCRVLSKFATAAGAGVGASDGTDAGVVIAKSLASSS